MSTTSRLPQATQDINAKWASLKMKGLDLGPAQGDIVSAGYGGYYRVFQKGRIYWHHTTGAHEVHGGILTRYLERGAYDRNPKTGRRELGFPTTDELRTVDGRYPVSTFEWGAIHWAFGCPSIHGDFYTAWKKMGGELSSLGYPLADQATVGGQEVMYFERGCMAKWGGMKEPVVYSLDAPKLGRPAVIHTDTKGVLPVRISVSIDKGDYGKMPEGDGGALLLWHERLQLQPVGRAGGVVPLSVEFSLRTETATHRVFGITFRVANGARLEDRTLYSLDLREPGGKTYTLAPHAFYAKRSWEDFGFIHATDIHVSRRLDGFRSILKQKGRTTSAAAFINWNDSFRDLIRYANKLHAEGKIDFIVATGDLVDYQFEDGDDRDGGGNFLFFEQLVRGQVRYPDKTVSNHEPLRVPIFTTLGNHDYREASYKLYFDIDVTAWPDPRFSHYAPFNLTKDDAVAIQGGKLDMSQDRAKRMIVPVTPRYYLKHLNDTSDYVLNLGKHRLVMINTGPDVGVIDGKLDAILQELGFGSADENAFASGSPNSSGVSGTGLGLMQRALREAGSNGLVFVGMHAPPFNMASSKYPPFMRETERPTVDWKQTLSFLQIVAGSVLNALKPGPGGSWLPPTLEEKKQRAEAQLRDWPLTGTLCFKKGNVSLGGKGIARGLVEDFVKAVTGQGTPRSADLVLFGHIHRHVDYRLTKNGTESGVRFHLDFYTENPDAYYPTYLDGVTGPVHLQVRPGAPLNNWQPAEVRDNRTGAVWKLWKSLSIRPYADPLSNSTNPGAWWKKHRPLFLQTSALGPIESNQREDTSLNKHKPGPTFRGVRMVSVENDVIVKISHVSSATLASEHVPMRVGGATPPPSPTAHPTAAPAPDPMPAAVEDVSVPAALGDEEVA